MKRPFIISLSLFIFIGCSLFDDDSPKDPRDYTWSIDTLTHPDHTNYQLSMREMWASSADDIYLVGHSSSANGAMWHYNGKSWSVVPIIKMFGGTVNNTSHSLNDIFGFSKHDVWAVGGKSGNKRAFVIHYNGIEWKEITPPDTSQLMSVGGGDNGEIWVGPYGGGIFNYNGTEWVDGKINFTGTHGVHSYGQDFVYRENYPPYMVYLNKEHGPRQFIEKQLYKNTDNNWNFIMNRDIYDITGPWISEEGIVYIGGFEVRKIIGNTAEIIGELPPEYGTSQLYGIRDDYIFGCGRYLRGNLGNIVFFDGNEWTMLLDENIENIFFTDIWANEEIVIALGNKNGETFILKGE